MKIPKIIHQIWSGIKEPLPIHFKELGDTWRRDYPGWKYILWDNEMMCNFVQENYPQHWDVYMKYPYHIQRWDAIRYLILDKIGGMYIDFDYESIESMEKIIEDKMCCFALEPQSHSIIFNKQLMFNNALMLNTPNHPFMKKIIKKVFSKKMLNYGSNITFEDKYKQKHYCIMNTTGPWVLIDLYNTLTEDEKKYIYLIPAKYVTPFDGYQAELFRTGNRGEDLEEALKEAYAVHYFFSDWRINDL